MTQTLLSYIPNWRSYENYKKNKINSAKKNQTKDQTILDKTVVPLREYIVLVRRSKTVLTRKSYYKPKYHEITKEGEGGREREREREREKKKNDPIVELIYFN
jgi:hypothetical protein